MEKSTIIREDIENIYGRNLPWDRLKNCTVLITGAYGMLASYVMYLLLYLNEYHNMGIHIIAAVRSREKFVQRFGESEEDNLVTIYTEPLEAPIFVEETVDYIIHAASFASPQYYAKCPVDVIKPNALGTYQLLKLAVEKKSKGFLFFSTGDVYGQVNQTGSICEDTLGVLDPLDIHSCYGESKRLAETMCYAYYKQYGVPTKMLRLWHTYAPTMDIENDPRVFASFMNNLVHGEDIVMKSDGSACRAFCYVADAVAAFFTVLFCGKNGEAYNICNPSEFCSIKQLADRIVSLREDISLKVITKERPLDDNYTENLRANLNPPSDEKLRQLGWHPEYTIEQGFSRVYSYWKEKNASYCKNL